MREFFRVAKLVPADQEPISVPVGTSVREALRHMAEGGFSQIPVMAGDEVVGVFSHRSLAQNLHHIRRQDDPLDAQVDDLLDDLEFVRATADVGDVLGYLGRDGAVLIGDEGNLVAVATATDAIDFFWQTARPFVLLQDIELAVRDLMRAACPDPGELAARITAALEGVAEEGARLEELSLGQMLSVLTSGENFARHFSATFGQSRSIVLAHMEAVREIRNQVFHFKDDVSVDQLETLAAARVWLSRKVRAARNRP